MSQTCLTKDSLNISISNPYPTDRSDYCLYTGELGENFVSTTIRDILPSSSSIPVHDISVNGSDIKIFYDTRLIGKFEVLNFNSSSYIDSKRALSIKENLKGVKYKGLICSFYNATSKANRILRNIPKCAIGFQLLPSKFHQYYARLNKVHHRRIANERSLKVLKNILTSFFYRIGLNMLMYVGRISRSRIPRTNVSERSEVSISKEIEGKSNTRKITISRYKNDDSNTWTGKMGGKSTVSKSFRPKSFKSSSTFRDKFKLKLKELVKLVGETLKVRILNLLSEMSRLWNDTSGNVSLTKRSKTTWRPRSGFQVSLNEIQTRLIPHTYPCKHKIPVFCTEHKKTKYICKLTIDPYKDHSGYLKFYKGRLYCFCADYGDDLCWLHKYICFNNMLRREDCKWSRSKWEEKWMFEDNLKKKMRDEMIREKINKNKIGMVKHD